MNFLNQQEISAFSEKVLKMLHDSEQNKTEVKKFATEHNNEDLDED